MAQPLRSDVAQPFSEKHKDFFGHRDYAAVIATTAASAPSPFTLGLFAPWGSGKSTILKEVKNQLPTTVAFVLFDVWKYEGLPSTS
jgi:predicted KAP-like P-loop ATPase